MANEDVLLRVQLEGDDASGSSGAGSGSGAGAAFGAASAAQSEAVRDEMKRMREEIAENMRPFQQAVADIRNKSREPKSAPDKPNDGDPRPYLPDDHVGSFDITKFRGRRKNQQRKERIYQAEAVDDIRPPKPPPVNPSGSGSAAGGALGAVGGPAGIAVGVAVGALAERGVVAAINKIRSSADDLVSTFRQLREQGDELNGAIASANAQAEIDLLLARQRNLNQSSDSIRSLIEGQSEFEIALESFKTELIETFEPLARDVLDTASSMLRVLEAILKASKGFIQELIDKGFELAGFTLVRKILYLIDFAIASIPGFEDDDANGAIDDAMMDFFNPNRFTPPNNAFQL